MKTEDVQEAIREYYIRRGYIRERLLDIHVKGGRKVKGNDIPNNGTVELTITDAFIAPIEEDIIKPSTFNAANEEVNSLVKELDGIMGGEAVVEPATTPWGGVIETTELHTEEQIEMNFEVEAVVEGLNQKFGVPSSSTDPKPQSAGQKFKSLFS